VVRLLLASASPARTATLASAGIAHRVLVSDVDEPAVLAAQAEAAARSGAAAPSPAEQVLALARAKAEDVAAALAAGARPSAGFPDDDEDRPDDVTLVLGCDSMLEADLGDGVEVVGKPRDPEVATRRWSAMRGSVGVLHTGHSRIALPGAVGAGSDVGAGGGAQASAGDVSSATIHFADLTDDEIARYVATGEPLKVAGGFTIDGLGGPFVESIEGDHHGVVGVSLPLVRRLTEALGYSITDLWV
jgi:septum formation protein